MAQFFYELAEHLADTHSIQKEIAKATTNWKSVIDEFNEYSIEKTLNRPVYVGDMYVGRIVGERHHPNKNRVSSLRLEVKSSIANEYMRTPAKYAPIPKEHLHNIQADGSVKLGKSMRELQRRWRNTVRIDEKLYAPDELLERAVFDNQGIEIGIVVGLLKIKRTYRGIVVRVRPNICRNHSLADSVNIPISSISRTRERMDELILTRNIEEIISLPSYVKINQSEAPTKNTPLPKEHLHNLDSDIEMIKEIAEATESTGVHWLPDHSVVNLLIALMKDDDDNVRRRAADALRKIGDVESLESLIEALNDDHVGKYKLIEALKDAPEGGTLFLELHRFLNPTTEVEDPHLD
jgi:hypothetical protein